MRRERGTSWGESTARSGSVRLQQLDARIVVVVRRDDLADQRVAYDVLSGEPVEGDVVHLVEDVLDRAQAGLLPARQVGLRDVAGDHDLGAEPQPGQEHLP